MRVLVAALITFCVTAAAADAQPFANARTSLAGYTVAESIPQKTCESLSMFKGEDITSIQARVVAATADTPQHCRVTGIIAPEVAFALALSAIALVVLVVLVVWSSRARSTRSSGALSPATEIAARRPNRTPDPSV